MAPVVRINDELFQRLQAIAEPLVDTPSRLIEKLLNHYESTTSATTAPRHESQRVKTSQPIGPPLGGATPNFFLAPARRANLEASLQHPVRVDFAERFLTTQEATRLREALGEKDEFYCWAASEGKLTYFEAMTAGDYVFFTETGTGRFTYVGRVATRLISESLGNAVWPDVPGLPWKFIYILDHVRRINLQKDRFLAHFGYEDTYPVYGFIRVAPERVRRSMSGFDSVDELINASS